MVSVVIPSFNSENTISRCLSSLLHQDYTDRYEVILVDSSVDSTPCIVRTQFPTVHFHHFDKKTDPGTARNFGVKKSTGELILFIDSDCVAEPDWIKKMVHLHQAYPDTVAIGGSALNGNDAEDLVGWASYISEFREFIPEQPRAFVQHIPTLNISYKRWVFEKFGYFDPCYYPQEDLILNFLITKNGEKILFDPEIKVWHTHRSICRDFLKHQQKIGEITAKVLKLLPLSGSFIARHKILYPVVGPLLPVVKFIKTMAVFLKKKPVLLLKHPLAVPLFTVGLFYWFYGFSKGVFSDKLRGIQ